jgi:hypothetical protein
MIRFPSAIQMLALATIVAATAGAAGCAKQIGDECTTAADCNPNGTRACDQSQPGGYCTIQGCDETSCPSEAVCIRFFPAQFLTQPCHPSATPTGECAADEICLDGGLCAPLSTELRYCVKGCEKDDDCRGGYECRLAGTRGSMALTSNPSTVIRFCAPQTSG